MQTFNIHDRYRTDTDKTVNLLSTHFAGMTIDELRIELDNCAERRIYRIFKYLRNLGLVITHEAPADISRSDVANMRGSTRRMLAHRYRILNSEIYYGSSELKKAAVSSVHFSSKEMAILAISLQSMNGKHTSDVKRLWEKLRLIGEDAHIEIAEAEPSIEIVPDSRLSEYLHLVGTGKQITMRLRDEAGNTCCRITGMALGLRMIGAKIEWKVSIISKGGNYPKNGVEEKPDYVLIDAVAIGEVSPGRIRGSEESLQKVS